MLDPLTPPAAIETAVLAVRQAYVTAGAEDAWHLLMEPDTAHVETSRMRSEVIDFLVKQLVS